jgi:glutamate decarboxylase
VALDRLQADGGLDVPIHVDAVSGLITPFLDPGLTRDFRLERVRSINASGHKYGLVYPGVGWVVWRDREACRKSSCSTWTTSAAGCRRFALNFSRPGPGSSPSTTR